ncbi:Tryptophan 2-halogenase [Leucoagaricus sp. SymC.cos]|nr:Tryptophan 2-halogenase [Leucoagaricus sp. SymC.cos]
MSTVQTSTVPPSFTSVLVIGGGPSGSYTAACLAQEGISVTLLEAETFPRYHVGESMLPSMRHFLRYIDADDKFNSFGFSQKHGAAFKFNPRKREGFTNFVSENPNNYAWNVTRADADALLLDRARELGVQIYENHRVTEIQFSKPSAAKVNATQAQNESQEPQNLPVSVTWKNVATGQIGTIAFDWVVDASGRNGIISRALGLRKYNQSLKNIAYWGYWTGTQEYRHPACEIQLPFFEALHDESGWACAYRQIRAQELPVLSDIDEDNFDKAFDLFRIVIQGDIDVKKGLSENSLRQTIDFCTQAFEPESMERWHGKEGDDSEVKDSEISEEKKKEIMTVNESLRAEDMYHIGKFVADKFNGFSIRFEKGRLGLQA